MRGAFGITGVRPLIGRGQGWEQSMEITGYPFSIFSSIAAFGIRPVEFLFPTGIFM